MTSGRRRWCGVFLVVKTAQSRGRTERTRIRHFCCHITVCYTQVIMPTSADAYPVVGGSCTGRERRCKPKQRRRGKTALTYGFYPHSCTVPGSRPEREQIFMVTRRVRYQPFVASAPGACRCRRSTQRRVRILSF